MGIGASRAPRSCSVVGPLFETFRAPDLAGRLRAATAAPLIAFVLSEFYFSLAPVLGRVPAWLFWMVASLTLCGVVTGIVVTTRLVVRRRRELSGRAITWVIGATVATAICAWRFLAMVVPWL